MTNGIWHKSPTSIIDLPPRNTEFFWKPCRSLEYVIINRFHAMIIFNHKIHGNVLIHDVSIHRDTNNPYLDENESKSHLKTLGVLSVYNVIQYDDYQTHFLCLHFLASLGSRGMVVNIML